jgi:hypothetical protein
MQMCFDSSRMDQRACDADGLPSLYIGCNFLVMLAPALQGRAWRRVVEPAEDGFGEIVQLTMPGHRRCPNKQMASAGAGAALAAQAVPWHREIYTPRRENGPGCRMRSRRGRA